MCQIPVYPDELVRLTCELIAYSGGEISLPLLWESSSKFVSLNDEMSKNFVFSCVTSDAAVTLYERGKVVHKSYSEIAANEDDFTLRIDEDTLWIILTGYRKKEANIGGSAFELLLEIAKAKESGINTKDLALATNQDPRSITGRVKKIGHLIFSVQMIYKGHVVKLLKLKKYEESDTTVKPYVNLRDHLEQIVDVVKKSKNGVRQIIDLKRELKFDSEKRVSKAFIAAIAWLDEKEYLKKVLVVSPTNPSVRIRCVKYLRDYVQEDKCINDFDYESDSGEDDIVDDEKLALDDDDAYEGLDSTNATSVLQQEGLVVQDEKSAEKNDILLNRFYPMQNQTYDITERAGLQGISTMEVISKMTGKDYKRAFTKSSEYYVDSVGKPTVQSSGYKIVRVYDFEGKKKFYRFFTEENFRKITDISEDITFNCFEPLPKQAENLLQLNGSNFVALSNTLHFMVRDGQEYFFWNGEVKFPSKISPAERKRKQEEKARNNKGTNTSLKRRKADRFLNTENETSSEGNILSNQAVEENGLSSKPKVLKVGGFSAGSLRSLRRQRAILEVVKKAGGVTYLREQFFEDVSQFMGSNTLLDKKTVRGDVNLMVENEKLRMQEEPNSGKRIIYLPGILSSTVSDFVIKEKDSRKAYFKDVIHNTDIYFFDQTEKHRFHRGVKSAERVRNYQNRDKAKKQPQDKATRKQAKNARALQKQYKLSRQLSSAAELATKNTVSRKAERSKQKTVFHVGNKVGARALIMAVVITKSIKNEIVWDQITKLFPNNSLENLKKQWTARRIRMGHAGWKAYVDKWRKVLLAATKEERVSLEDLERLDLPKLINLWIASDIEEDRKPIYLYRDYLENKRRYTLVRVSPTGGVKSGLAMSSMIQRESSSLKKVYVYDDEGCTRQHQLPAWGTEEDIRAVIRSILFDNSATSRDEIKVLNNVPKERVDKVIMDMAKEKHLYLHGSKLEATNTIKELLEAKGNYTMFEGSEIYRKKLEEMFRAGNGVIINEEIPDVASWIFIELITQSKVHLDVIPTMHNKNTLSYVTRRFGIRGLTPPLIISPNKPIIVEKEEQVPVPMGEPNSRLWIDSVGNLRPTVWKSLLSMLINEILFNPSICLGMLENNFSSALSKRELKDICDWLLKKGLIYETPFLGLKATHNWFTALK
ncbi:BN860_08064g1_1 [Zygosaccharomyces bailii CLIB 213]|uniref:BN860_08064g1_1 n=1 Tax=Zygosaccharomyces bailii (strain CLIB 213 / ATCC 58445 / CBS 680 / BCRC 21525 / NBRC 1098 / NCYC 1416 / NRRL Y-2227) TaxID=1333698 RepID=A0A8J2T1J1_ZYGB2|nr:BN860_08064g1_1 [Zygosaccharomyces bailii CLIB 213]